MGKERKSLKEAFDNFEVGVFSGSHVLDEHPEWNQRKRKETKQRADRLNPHSKKITRSHRRQELQ